MVQILVGVLFSISIVIMSFDGFVTNKKLIQKIDLIHKKGRKHIKRFLKSSFKSAPKSILYSSVQYVIYFWIGVYFLSMLIFGISNSFANVNPNFILGELQVIFAAIIVSGAIKFGLECSFKKFKSLWKTEMGKILKSPIMLLAYIILSRIILALLWLNQLQSNLFLEREIKHIKTNGLPNEFLLFFIYPILFLLGFMVIVSILFLIVWGLSRILSFVSYKTLKSIFSLSYSINKKRPLKPLLVMIKVIVIIITPTIVFFVNLFSV